MGWLKRIWVFLFGGKHDEKHSNSPAPLPDSPKEEQQRPGGLFDKAFIYTLKNEGGYSDIPEDKGGATNWGIIHEELSRWRKRPVSKEDVKNLTQEEAKQIYKAWYWDKLNLDRIKNEKVALALFDRAILNGLTGVSRFVRKIYKDTSNDGANFNNLIDKVNAHDPKAFVVALANLCEENHR